MLTMAEPFLSLVIGEGTWAGFPEQRSLVIGLIDIAHPSVIQCLHQA